MNLWLRVATAGTETWCRAYTRGLPAAVRQARLDELGSDMWEQRSFAQQSGDHPSDTGFSILSRLLCGMPSDLVWRQSAAKGPVVALPPGPIRKDGKMFARMFVAFSSAIAVVLGLFMVMNGVGALRRDVGDGSLIWASIGIIGGGLLLASVAVARRSPRMAAVMASVAALVLAGSYYWMIAIGLPLAVILIVGAVIRTKEPVPLAP